MHKLLIALLFTIWCLFSSAQEIPPIQDTDYVTLRSGGAALSDSNYIHIGQLIHDNLNLNANLQINNLDVSSINSVPVNDSGGSLTIDNSSLDTPLSTRATENTLLDVLDELITANTELVSANSSLDAIETDADNIRIAAQSIDSDINVNLSTRASEVTVASILSRLDVALSTRASEVTLSSIDTKFNVSLSTRASEATLATRASESTLASFQSANHTDLLGVQTRIDTTSTVLGGINSSVNSNLVVLQGINNSISTNTDGLETLSTSTNTKLDTVNTNLVILQGYDSSINSNTDAIETRLGDLTETAPATDTASSGLNGRLQRIAQRITTGNASLSSLDTDVDVALSTRASLANQTNGTHKTQVVDGSGNVAPSGDTAARSGFSRITDGTNTGTVKAASTAAVAADTAIVVAVSPNNIITATPTGVPLTANSPTTASVGGASAQALASNANRKGLILVNTSGNKTISIAFGATAVLNSGVTLYPGGTFTMDAFTMSTAAVNAIASGASSGLAIQEYQ